MERMYPCDASGMCPYETFDNPERMYFCRDHCGLGCDDSDDPAIWEELWEEDWDELENEETIRTLEWLESEG